MNFIIESDFIYKDYRCITTFSKQGYRCGYIGLPKGHPLYGKRYNSQIPVTFKEMEQKLVGKRSPIQWFCFAVSEPDNHIEMGLYFNVHGGITYVDGGKDSIYPIKSDLWWLGLIAVMLEIYWIMI